MKIINRGMKNIGACCALALAGLSLGCHAAVIDSVGGLELLDTMGRYQQDLHILYAETPTDTKIKDILAMSEKLGQDAGVVFDIDTLQAIEGRIGLGSSQDPSASFEVDRTTGGFLFNGGLGNYRNEAATPGLPAEKDAIYLAGKIVEGLGLSTDPGEMVLSHVGGWNMAVTDGKGDSTIFEKLKIVRYDRVLDGLPVEGDARITVQFGEDAKVAGLIYQWPTVAKQELIDASALQDPSDLRERALQQINSVVEAAINANLTNVELVLYDDGKGIMEPAYHLVVERYFDYGTREAVMIPYDFYVPTTVKPRAFYPYMDVADLMPEDGSVTEATKTESDE
jgi:hypothetical protein